MDFEVKKILKPGKTRWLSLEAAIKRILEFWEPLHLYFVRIREQNFFENFTDNKLKIYLEFLGVFLSKINSINQYL